MQRGAVADGRLKSVAPDHTSQLDDAVGLVVDDCRIGPGQPVAQTEEALRGGKPEVFNTDQGVQFTAEAFTRSVRSARP